MPEGVEIRLSAEIIKPLIMNKLVVKAFPNQTGRYASGNNPEGYDEFIKSFRTLTDIGYIVDSLKIIDLKTKGKFTYWCFDNGFYMFTTFGMSGQYSPIAGKHICFTVKLTNPMTLEDNFIYFNDPRHFGTIKFTNDKKELLDKLNDLGWDPLQDKLSDYINFINFRLSRTNKPIGELLLDQKIFAGVGNYIRAEALYAAKISPWQQCNLMSKGDILSLCQAIIEVMNDSYAHQGATLKTYKDAYGNEGKYSSCFKVYSKKQDPFGNAVIKQATPEGRTIHWCPLIQK